MNQPLDLSAHVNRAAAIGNLRVQIAGAVMAHLAGADYAMGRQQLAIRMAKKDESFEEVTQEDRTIHIDPQSVAQVSVAYTDCLLKTLGVIG